MLQKYTKMITKCSLTIYSTIFALSCLLHVDFFHLKLSQNKNELYSQVLLCFSEVFLLRTHKFLEHYNEHYQML